MLTESISNSSFGIYMPRWAGTIYEVLSAPISYIEIVRLRRRGGDEVDLLGWIILATARLFVPFSIEHPLWMIAFLVLTSVTFSLFGFIIGLWASGWEKLQIVPILIITPLAFLGGSFYSIGMLPPFWQKVTLFNPVVYLINGFRWAFYGIADVSVVLSLGMTFLFMTACLAVICGCSRPATASRRDLLFPVARYEPNRIIAIPTPAATPNGSFSTSTPITSDRGIDVRDDS